MKFTPKFSKSVFQMSKHFSFHFRSDSSEESREKKNKKHKKVKKQKKAKSHKSDKPKKHKKHKKRHKDDPEEAAEQFKVIDKKIPIAEHTNGVESKITTDPKKLVEILTKSVVDERTTMEIISSDSESEG